MTHFHRFFSLVLICSLATAAPSHAQTAVCVGQQVNLELPAGLSGSIQWQDSLAGGSWNNISGATSSTYSFTPAQAGFYRALVTAQNCAETSGVIAITLNQAPSTAVAGANVTGASGTITLNANAPTVGSGLWSIASGTGGSFGNPTQPNSSFSGLAGATYELVWTISNPPCEPSADTLTVVYDTGPALPTIVCNGTTLQVHPTDNAGPTAWGCSGVVSGASSDVDGQLNTTTIVAACTAPTAAGICDALVAYGASDWYLPAYNELLCMRDSAAAIGGFAAGAYWSSTEGTGIFTANARYRTFPSGTSGYGSKSNTNRIRCVRQGL
jgi:hypothetical protein